VVSRRSSTGETAGERLFDISYVHPRRTHRLSELDNDDDDDDDAESEDSP